MAETRKPNAPLAGDVANQPGKVKSAGPAADLSPEEQEAIRASDSADAATPKAAGPDTSGKRVRYIAYGGGTHAELRRADFAREGLDHPDVSANFRNNVFTFEVGEGKGKLSQEAADLITKKYPTMFEFLNENESSDESES
jgi:hypothetical protein